MFHCYVFPPFHVDVSLLYFSTFTRGYHQIIKPTIDGGWFNCVTSWGCWGPLSAMLKPKVEVQSLQQTAKKINKLVMGFLMTVHFTGIYWASLGTFHVADSGLRLCIWRHLRANQKTSKWGLFFSPCKNGVYLQYHNVPARFHEHVWLHPIEFRILWWQRDLIILRIVHRGVYPSVVSDRFC